MLFWVIVCLCGLYTCSTVLIDYSRIFLNNDYWIYLSIYNTSAQISVSLNKALLTVSVLMLVITLAFLFNKNSNRTDTNRNVYAVPVTDQHIYMKNHDPEHGSVVQTFLPNTMLSNSRSSPTITHHISQPLTQLIAREKYVLSKVQIIILLNKKKKVQPVG